MSNPSLLDAVRIAKDNERIASESYAHAAEVIRHQMGKHLFTQLSEFEKFHLELLTTLEKSLEASGEFINYQGREFPLPPIFDIKAAQEPNQKSIMTIVSEAIELEKKAETTYSELAKQVDDQRGKKLFTRLALEESVHYRILLETYWTMNELGVWKWSRPTTLVEIKI